MSSPSCLERLPDELKEAILSRVGDVYSLFSAAITGPSLYQAFMCAERKITTTVLLEYLKPGVVYDALARFETLTIDSLDYEKVQDFLTKFYTKGKSLPALRWTLRSALIIARLQRLIETLTERFILQTKETFDRPELSPASQIVTPAEVCRIQRAFYRYEIFCNLFRPKAVYIQDWYNQDYTGMWLQDTFLSKFSTWENEQLACVFDFLFDKASPLFDEFAQHDVEWGSNRIDWGQDGKSGFFKYFLASGLERVERLVYWANTHERRAKILTAHPPWRGHFLADAFKRINGMPSELKGFPASDTEVVEEMDYRVLDDLTPEEESIYVRTPFYDDPDPGPENMWRWASRYMFVNRFIHTHDDKLKWRYVMWDSTRMQGLGILGEHGEVVAQTRHYNATRHES